MDDPHELDPNDVSQRIADGTAVLVDVRDASAYAQDHAAGAHSIPIDELEARIAELPSDVLLVTSCGGGTRGPRAAALARSLGRDATVMRGGLRGWRAADLPTSSGDTGS